MSAFLLGWGVFWLLFWASVVLLLSFDRDAKADTMVVPMIGLMLSIFYLIAVFVGRALA